MRSTPSRTTLCSSAPMFDTRTASTSFPNVNMPAFRMASYSLSAMSPAR